MALNSLNCDLAAKHKILVVDDEEDVHGITEIALKSLKYQGRGVEILDARSAAEAMHVMRSTEDVAIVLMDVVMESFDAGLEACRSIREDLGNRFTRILLRTGQPGMAPEKSVVQEYDIDGYIPKGEITSTRLFTTVRASLKAYGDLRELEYHRRSLESIHDCVQSLTHQSVDVTLRRLVETVLSICPTPLAVLHLTLLDDVGDPQEISLGRNGEGKEVGLDIVRGVKAAMDGELQSGSISEEVVIDNAFVTPIRIPHGLGQGWLYVEGTNPHQIVRHCLPLLMTHGANAIYPVLSKNMIDAYVSVRFREA